MMKVHQVHGIPHGTRPFKYIDHEIKDTIEELHDNYNDIVKPANDCEGVKVFRKRNGIYNASNQGSAASNWADDDDFILVQ